MSYRWMTSKDLSAAVRARDILNSRVKRGEIEAPSKFTYVVCGCGEEGCGFISCYNPKNDETTSETGTVASL